MHLVQPQGIVGRTSNSQRFDCCDLLFHIVWQTSTKTTWLTRCHCHQVRRLLTTKGLLSESLWFDITSNYFILYIIVCTFNGKMPQWTNTWTVYISSFIYYMIWYDSATLYLAFASEIPHLMSAQRLGRARKLLMLHGGDGKHRVSQVSGSSTWTKALGETATIRAWLISQCTKRLVPGISCAQANCGLQSPNGCTLRFCSVVRLSIGPVDDVGSYKDHVNTRSPLHFINHMEDKSPCWTINEDFLDSDAPIFRMSDEKKTYRNKCMECHHRYLCSYRLDTTCDNKREQLRFHDLIFQPGVQETVFILSNYSVNSGFPEPFHRTDFQQNGLQNVAKNRERKDEGKWRRHSNWKKEKKGNKGY